MSGWWLDVADHPVNAVQLVGGNPAQIAVWLTNRTVQFYDMYHGAFYASFDVVPPADNGPSSAEWRAFLGTLRAPNGAYLPVVDAGRVMIHTSRDGRVRLFYNRDHALTLELDGDQIPLRDGNDPVLAVGLDRELATVAALSRDNRLHFYQQHVYVGAYELNVQSDSGDPVVMLPEAAGIAIVIAGSTMVICDTAGHVDGRLTLPFMTTVVSCSPDGNVIALVDREQGMIRVYDGDLRLTHQRRAWDVLEQAAPLQLLAGLPLADAVPEAIAVGNDGVLVFAIDGVICQSHLDALTPLPQARSLL